MNIFTITKPLVEQLSKLQQIEAICCIGSQAMGIADRKSDIDLYIFCKSNLPDSTKRLKILKELPHGNRIVLKKSNPNWNEWSKSQETFYLSKVLIETAYNTTEWIIKIVNKTKKTGALSLPECPFRSYTILGMLDNSIILYDRNNRLTNLKNTLYPYPVKLKNALMKKGMSICEESLENLTDYVKRGIGNNSFLFHFGRITDAINTMIYAINNKYDPATKRFEESIKNYPNLPRNFLIRFNKLLEGPFNENAVNKMIAANMAVNRG